MTRHRSTARLVEALADLKQFDRQNASVSLALNPMLASERRRIDTRVTELAALANVAHYELGDFDDQVRAEMLRRRSVQRRVRTSRFEDAFDGMMNAAGVF